MLKWFVISHCLLFISKKVLSANEAEVFTVFTKGCNIRRFPLFHQNIEKLVGSPSGTRNCSENIPLVDANSTHFWVVDNSLDIFGVLDEDKFYCCYRHFHSKNTVQNITYGKCIDFYSVLKAKHQFIRVECTYYDVKIYEAFFMFKDRRYFMQNENRKNYNILIFGIESVSRMNFHRTMAKTADYLRRKGSIELLGYNKVGDNSYPNLFPLLTGHNFKFVKNICIDKHGNYEIKVCPFIWDKYKKAGYRTALGSDSIAGLLGEYEYNFTNIPTDFYLQPLMYEARNLFKNRNYNYHQCLGSKYFYKTLLDYIKDLADKLKYNRLFGMFWEESVSHEHLNNPYIMDEDYLQLLITLEENSYLDETIIVFVSDHGMRWGDFVHTEQGKQEERLPLLQILFPESFKQKYKSAIKNFQINSERLTTPHDIYLTLLDLIDPTLLEDKIIGQRSKSNKSLNQTSLFLPVSRKRTCASVGIKDHWCACFKGKKLKVGNLLRILAAQFVVQHINELLESHILCQKLSISKIIDATMVKKGTIRVYNVILETIPGEAILDGTVLRDGENWTVSGTVSRLNRYGNTDCVSDDRVKLYCFCSE